MLVTSVHSMHHAAGMSKLKDLWGSREKSASPKSESKQSDSGSSSNRATRSYETTRSNLDELGILGKSSRSSREQPENKREREEPREGRSLLQRARETLSRGRGDSKRERDIEISGPSNFRVTTDESLARMKPEDAEKIRKAQASQNTQLNILLSKDNTTPDIKNKILKEESPDEIAIRLKRKEEQESKAKQVAKDLDSITKQLNETRSKINKEMEKDPDNRDTKLLAKLNLEKKKLGDKSESMEKTVKNIEAKARLDGLSTQELAIEVARLQEKSDQAQKKFELTQSEQNLRTNRFKEALKNLSSDDRDEYKKLAQKQKEIEDKLADKTTPKNEIGGLLDQRKKIKSGIQNISSELANRRDELVNHENTFVTDKKNVQSTQTSLTLANVALEERIAQKESDIIKSASTKKRVGFADDTQSTGPEKNVGFSVDQKSFEEFQKRAGPPPSKLPPLPTEAEKTKSDDLSPAMKRKSTFEEEKFNQKSSKSTPSAATGDAWIETVQESPIKSKYGELTPQEKKARLQEIYESNAKLIEQEKTR